MKIKNKAEALAAVRECGLALEDISKDTKGTVMKKPSEMRNVLCVGDVHARWAWLASLLLYFKPDVCICAGDFGWWPKFIDLPGIALPSEVLEQTEIRFCDGNHEDHPSLLAAAPRGRFEPVEIMPGIVYQPRGSVMEIADGRRVLFAGGAMSVDRKFRTEGRDWFPEEVLRPEHLPSPVPDADVVVSHTVPLRFGLNLLSSSVYPAGNLFDPSREALDIVLEGAKPDIWIAGHWHERKDWMLGRMECHVLDMVYGGVCRPEGTPWTFWLSGGPGIERTGPGWALPGGAFLPLRESGSKFYACADLEAMDDGPMKKAALRLLAGCTAHQVDGVWGVKPGDADRMLENLCRNCWRA